MTRAPYTKAEAEAKLPKQLPDTVLEYINNNLQTYVGTPISLDYSSIAELAYPHMRRNIVQLVREKYEPAGWRVVVSQDQRDGDFIIFS